MGKGSYTKEIIEAENFDLDDMLRGSAHGGCARAKFPAKLLCTPKDNKPLPTGGLVEAAGIADAALFLQTFNTLQKLADSDEIQRYATAKFGTIGYSNAAGVFNALKGQAVINRWNEDRMSMSSTIRNGDQKARANFVNVYTAIHSHAVAGSRPKIPKETWISVDLIKAVHQYLNLGSTQNDVVPGAFRRKGTQVGWKNPLPAHYIGEALQLFSEWFAKPSHFQTSGNLVAALAVFLVECITIHPFLDGNGRVCRAV